ncbi:hypothetical protein BpHYR1_037494 [Brachionus plicatilis]|uniref:Uncharacterized protein n=1 Tax=Brachionus plicatilis TaxID=10195 RepID=A0A3M7PJH4_BRAPC|nr:hypothetical protein BpHYR1_037494 [Brachionus plicatilis]
MELPRDSKSIFNYPKAPLNSDEWPVVTIISVCFIGIWALLITLLKIMTSTEEYFDENKFDLIMFKPSAKIIGIGCRKLFDNSPVSRHNIKVMTQSGFDISKVPISTNYNRRYSLASNSSIY